VRQYGIYKEGDDDKKAVASDSAYTVHKTK
jgi:hypothetical protein